MYDGVQPSGETGIDADCGAGICSVLVRDLPESTGSNVEANTIAAKIISATANAT